MCAAAVVVAFPFFISLSSLKSSLPPEAAAAPAHFIVTVLVQLKFLRPLLILTFTFHCCLCVGTGGGGGVKTNNDTVWQLAIYFTCGNEQTWLAGVPP